MKWSCGKKRNLFRFIEMDNGALLTLIGLTFSGFSFIYVALNPWNIDGIEGLLVSLMGTNIWLLLLVAMIL